MIGMYAPPVYGFGECSVGLHSPGEPGDPGLGRGWVTIDRADPRILVSGELAAEIARGCCMPYARVTKTCICSPEIVSMCQHFLGAKLEIRGENRAVIYVITEQLFAADCWVAEWPD